jgi:hypothetical protein
MRVMMRGGTGFLHESGEILGAGFMHLLHRRASLQIELCARPKQSDQSGGPIGFNGQRTAVSHHLQCSFQRRDPGIRRYKPNAQRESVFERITSCQVKLQVTYAFEREFPTTDVRRRRRKKGISLRTQGLKHKHPRTVTPNIHTSDSVLRTRFDSASGDTTISSGARQVYRTVKRVQTKKEQRASLLLHFTGPTFAAVTFWLGSSWMMRDRPKSFLRKPKAKENER